MKKLLFAISFLAITALAFAGNNNAKTITPEKRLDFSIQQQVAIPNFLMDQQGEHSAEVHFTLHSDGTVNVQNIVSDEKDLKENLMYQLKTFRVNTEGLDLKDTYKVVVRFNVL